MHCLVSTSCWLEVPARQMGVPCDPFHSLWWHLLYSTTTLRVNWANSLTWLLRRRLDCSFVLLVCHPSMSSISFTLLVSPWWMYSTLSISPPFLFLRALFPQMVSHPKHVAKALAQGVDLICAQASEGGGHTGDVLGTLLWPACIDECKGRVSSFTSQPVHMIAAGAIYDGRGLAAALSYGAQAVWVGTHFVASIWGSCIKETQGKVRHHAYYPLQ